ncbi:hypothetical protein Cgig2_029142 [Carnegiea gigantea]|uniref:Transmembrane protein n=1 Tax=Carnegiea gigantea TaxID=171969 RepID=A0A9Q1KLG0_9CARY|nr:hypothetical protein Cgig2_029142 [Carnegiea gigantea]
MARTPSSAITHADLAPRPRTLDLGSKVGALLTIFCILCGLLCFNDGGGQKGKGGYECVYSGSGKVPLICASVSFVTLAIAMLIQHSFLLIALSKAETPTFLSWEDPHSSMPLKSLTWQAAFFFFSTWICFAVGEIMQLIGLSVESGHLSDWSTPRSSCLAIRQGVFTAAGILSLVTVFLAASLYATMLRVQWLCQEQENTRHEVLEASVLYASPPRSPPHDHHPMARDSLTSSSLQNPNVRTSSMFLSLYKAALDQKQATLA